MCCAEPILRRGASAVHTFNCQLCGNWAATVQLTDGELVVSSFVSRLTVKVPAEAQGMLCEVIAAGDTRALYAIDLEFAPFYCPRCDACYCGEHWTRWDVFDDDGWHDSIRGLCPQGHERMLED
jgi:hypothetical protein